MVLQRDDRRVVPGIPVQRAPLRAGVSGTGIASRPGALVPAGRPPATTPTPADVAVGAVSLALGAARSVVDVGVLAGQQTLDRLPLPSGLRVVLRRAWLTTGDAGMRRRADLGRRLASFLDRFLPVITRELLARIELTRLVREFVDLDQIAAGLDVDAIADRVDVDRVADRVDLDRAVARVDLDPIIDRIDLDELAARIDLDRILERVDLDELAARIDLDRILERVDLDRAVTRVDLDPIIERADVVGLARYVIDAIDLPELIRSSTGSMTSDMVRGVRVQGADADEAVQRVVDRLLRRRKGRDDLAPGGER